MLLRADPPSSEVTERSGWGLTLPCGAAQAGGGPEPPAALLFGSELVMSQEEEAEKCGEKQ